MQHLVVSGAVRSIYGSLGVKRILKMIGYTTDLEGKRLVFLWARGVVKKKLLRALLTGKVWEPLHITDITNFTILKTENNASYNPYNPKIPTMDIHDVNFT